MREFGTVWNLMENTQMTNGTIHETNKKAVSTLRCLKDHVLLAKHLQREMQKQQLAFSELGGFHGLTKKGKPTGNHRFSHEIWDFPVIFPIKPIN